MGWRSLDYVREKYGVPVKRGQRVTVEWSGNEGVVTSGDGQYVRVRLDGEKYSDRYHPFDLDYGDGITPQQRRDHANARIDAWNDRLNDRITAEEYSARMAVPLIAQPEPVSASRGNSR